MVKRCQWGLCNSDSRYPERLTGGVEFIPFPKPKRNLETCKRWIKACGRPHKQLNISVVDGNYQLYVCTKHFQDGKPTDTYPDPIHADVVRVGSKCTPARRPPKRRPDSEPPAPRKRRKVLLELNASAAENTQPIEPALFAVQTDSAVPDCSHQENLELLALVVETDTLQNQLQASHRQLTKQILLNEQLRRENQQLKEQSKSVNVSKTKSSFSIESVRDSPVRDNFKYYTGFVYVQFMSIFKFLVPNKFECPINFSRTISSAKYMRLEDQFLLTMVKLRLNLQFKHMANLFEISPQDAGALFRQWINYMFYRFGSVPLWPEREVIQDNMPKKFREDFPNTFIILDGTELKVQKPSSLRSQTQCYSDYKSHTTLKGLVGIDPRGSFTFISMLFSGSMSDKEITTASGLLDMLQQLIDCGRLKKGDGVMVDKGFLIKNEIQKLGLELFIPPFAPGAGQMSAGDVALTRKIAGHRVHVERAISRAKKFKIVANRMDLTLFPCVNQIWFNCCFLTGFMPLLINKKD